MYNLSNDIYYKQKYNIYTYDYYITYYILLLIRLYKTIYEYYKVIVCIE